MGSNVQEWPEPDLVRCIACRTVYRKPASVGDASAHQNCPECGYVGWLSVAIPIDPRPLRAAFGRLTL